MYFENYFEKKNINQKKKRERFTDSSKHMQFCKIQFNYDQTLPENLFFIK